MLRESNPTPARGSPPRLTFGPETAAFWSECLLRTASLAGPRLAGAGDARTEEGTDGCNPLGCVGADGVPRARSAPSLRIGRVGVQSGEGGEISFTAHVRRLSIDHASFKCGALCLLQSKAPRTVGSSCRLNHVFDGSMLLVKGGE